MEDLFGPNNSEETAVDAGAPLAARMRPRSLEEYLGQNHILGPGKLLRRAIESDRLTSIILFGPPGSGKTSLAQIIASMTKSHFERMSGVESSVADIRRVAASAAFRRRSNGGRTVLFIDEIHRFNKAQQDVLLPDVESGNLRLIGATTHNPFFYINSPLVSRSQVFQLEPLSREDLVHVMKCALSDSERGFGRLRIKADPAALDFLAEVSDGDARRSLNALEIAVLTTAADADGVIWLDLSVAQESVQKKAVSYDAGETEHYDTISAFIKSMRGSDPDAALYWLAKMLYAGEDIRFITRRIVIAASEDVGMADPNALVIAVAAQQAVEFVGLPEAQIPLAHAAVYVAVAPKSNRAWAGLTKAMEDVKHGRILPVPQYLRGTGSKLFAQGGDYKYAHDHEGGYVPQAYLPEGRIYYEPTENGFERCVKERLDYWRTLFEQAKKAESAAG
ncbi:MAG: replication-associated recombination protein A [Verrucomicrobia bacterium]|nr:replication-associated recombination protein A [Verrucomicrobiota bacterium]